MIDAPGGLAFKARVIPRLARVAACLLATGAGASTPAADPGPALTIQLIRPDLQCARLLDLFEGARAPHPAAALAGWKRAVRAEDRPRLSKTWDALITSVNPEMVREWRVLDRSRLVLGFNPADGRLRWSATFPNDDGTLAALATALALTDGGREESLGDLPVDRLGPPGSPLMAQAPGALLAAGSRDELDEARARLARAEEPAVARYEVESGVVVRLDLEALSGPSAPLLRRRVGLGLEALGYRSMEAVVAIEGDHVRAMVIGRGVGVAGRPAPVLDPDWLDWIPASGALAAFAWAIDPDPSAWDAFFAAADRIERADPARAGVAPIRTRLNLLARAAGVRPESEIWPRLRGVTGAVVSGPGGRIDGAWLAIHAEDPAAAGRIAERVIPALASAAGANDARPPDADGLRTLGRVAGRPLVVTTRDATVLVGWGAGVVEAAIDAHDRPGRSAGPSIRAGWGPTPPRRAGAVWAGRLPGLAPGSPLALALKSAPPVVWWGVDADGTTTDEVRCPGLQRVVRRFLDELPLDPAPSP